MLKDKVEKLLNDALAEHSSLFLINFSITSNNVIHITLDGDSGVNLQDCMNISRAIEHNLDREDEDFSLVVASAGATTPLVMPRQYKKNIGRKLKVRTATDSFEGNLTKTTEEGITLEWKAREPKPIGKGKRTVQKVQEIAFAEIEEAKVVLKF